MYYVLLHKHSTWCRKNHVLFAVGNRAYVSTFLTHMGLRAHLLILCKQNMKTWLVYLLNFVHHKVTYLDMSIVHNQQMS